MLLASSKLEPLCVGDEASEDTAGDAESGDATDAEVSGVEPTTGDAELGDATKLEASGVKPSVGTVCEGRAALKLGAEDETSLGAEGLLCAGFPEGSGVDEAIGAWPKLVSFVLGDGIGVAEAAGILPSSTFPPLIGREVGEEPWADGEGMAEEVSVKSELPWVGVAWLEESSS